ncbi:MAG: heparinase II/III family protein, partial [Planctomycetales bacterium]|nr:heparinase II/III family protein [Planctomycetales bacterium]
MTKLNRRLALGVSAATLLSAQAAPAARPFAGAVFTPERLERAKVNFRQYPWVQDRAAELGRTVAPLLQLSLRELWELVPGPNLGRTIDVVMTRDAQAQTTRRKPCPSCGVDGGYAVRPQSGRFTVFCSACGDRFPKNDFGSVYRTARGDDGFFDPQAIDRRLLVPRSLASDGSSLPIVDDGSGWPDDTGFVFRFVPFAVDQLWNVLINGARNLADYWALSGDAEGARRAAVIIDRVADCYPDMDWAPLAKKGWYHSDGDSGRGKIFGRISESRVLPNLVQAYDQTLAFVGSDKELHTFFKEQAASWSLPTEKGSGELYRKAVEERLLRTGLKAIQEERIRGNHGMHEFAAAWCAVALQHEAETQQWLDWVFSESGLQVPNTILGHMDRDGLGNEGAPAYAWGWGFAFHELAELLRRYGRYDRWVLQRDFIPFRRSYTAPYRMTLPDGRVPTLGDFGSCMEFAGPRTDTHHLFEGFRLTEDPAIAAEIAKLSPEFDVCRDPFDENPAAWPERLQTAAEQTLPTAAGGQFLPGFGLATLDLAGAQGNTAVWLAFGRNRGHGHPDSLNLGLVSHGVDLLPDIGYPDFATRNYAKRADWTSNTISHNTVVVDGQRQPGIWSGRVRHYKRLPQLGLGLMEVDSPTYAQTSLYRRSVVLLQRPDGGSYCWDLFRVQGGSEHIQSWHGPEGDVNLPANAEKRPSTLDLREATPYLTAPTDLVAPADEPLKLRYLSHPRWRTDGTQVGLQWMALNDSQL